MNWYKTSQTKKDFLDIGREQRGSPESAMIKAQRELGGGVLSYTIEHAGDLIHRMNDPNTFDYAGYQFVKEKVDKLLYTLTNQYGFEKEHVENMRSNAKYRNETLFERDRKIKPFLEKYIEEHNKLKSYNRAHELAKTVAISIASLKINRAILALQELKSHLGSEKEWTEFAHENLKKEPSEYVKI